MLVRTDLANPIHEETKTVSDYIGVFLRRRFQFFAVSGAVLFVSLMLAFFLPAVYQSSATILIEQQEIPQDLVRSTITSYADQRVQVISQRVMTTANLSEIVNKFDLYPDAREKEPLEVVLDDMRDDIKMNLVSADVVDPRSGHPMKATIAFTVSYRSRSQNLAQKVANELVSLYLNENLKARTESAVETSTFLSAEAERLRKNISDLETKLAAFKAQNYGRLPELVQLNTELMDRTERELAEVDRQIQDMENRRIMFAAQLAQLRPHGTLFSETGERILGPNDKLKVLQTEYLTAVARYSAKHPDVIRLKNEIDALKQKASGDSGSGLRGELETRLNGLRADLAAVRERYAPDHPDVKKLTREVQSLQSELDRTPENVTPIRVADADNPAYIEIKAQLDAAEVGLQATLVKKESLRLKLNEYEQRLMQTPQVEREYRQLTRDYEAENAKYQEITKKQMEAKLAENLETERKGEKLTMIEPPLFPEKPASPNRIAISLIGLMLSLAGGLGTISVAEGVDPRIHGSRDLARLNLMPLATIPDLETDADVRRRRNRIWGYLLATIAFATILIFLLHFFVSPVDVLWFRVMRRLGL